MPNPSDTELLMIIREMKESAYNWKYRRHEEWQENYTLYRDKIRYNRLTQRQTINLPLMKGTVKTLLKDIDTPPQLYYKCRDNDDQKEVFYNGYWEDSIRHTKLGIRDIIDKKQVLLFGRSFKMLNIVQGRFTFEIVDPMDMLVDRFVDPADLDSANFICQTNIWKPLRSLKLNPLYNKGVIADLEKYYASDRGLIKNEALTQYAMEKNARMEELGVPDVDHPLVGESYVELNRNLLYLDHPTYGQVWHVVVTANDMGILLKAPLCDVLGHTPDNFWYRRTPYNSWADDVERTDFWSDSVADTIRSSNHVLNAWISQLVENRTLKNLGMTFYDSTNEEFVPQTYQPMAWGFYPVPGDPNKLTKRVDIPNLDESIDEMNFLISLMEKASAATSLQQGVSEKQQITLGEINILIGNAKDRVRAMASLYTDSWLEFGLKYTKLLESAGENIDEVTLEKKGRITNKVYTRDVSPSDWESEKGYSVEVRDETEADEKQSQQIQWLNASRNVMPGNPVLDSVYKRKTLELAKLPATQIEEIMQADRQMQQQMMLNNQMMMQAGQTGMAPGAGQVPQGNQPLMLPPGN